MIVSSGNLKSTSVVWTGSTSTWGNWATNLELSNRWSSYSEIYKQQLWVYVVVNKRARATARLPFKVYQRVDEGRIESFDSPLANVLRNPNPRHSSYFLWSWTASTRDIYGEAFWLKRRDAGGRVVQLWPLHPTSMHADSFSDGSVRWTFQNERLRLDNIPESELVHFKGYNPDSFDHGLSPLEPLRRTLENEDASRRATSAFWRNGARPGVALSHPGKLSQQAADRLKINWDAVASGADNVGKTVVLEEGMKPEVMTLSAEEAQYIESRKLNREEVCGAYDVPPPVVHILDHATFSNITEQMRSMYRDTMAPILKEYESTIQSDLRDTVRLGASEPDFSPDYYAEFLLDEVLRGDFEMRMDAYQKAINSGHMMPSEARAKENLPFIEGSDRLLINSTMVPIAATPEEQLALPPGDSTRSIMGRLGSLEQRLKELGDKQ